VFNDTHASSDIDKANLFNTYLSSVFSNDSSVPFELPEDIIFSNHIRDIEVSKEEVFEALTSLDPNKAMAIDPKILKFRAPVLVQPIYHLFLLSLIHQSLPLDQKIHIISPVYKSGNKSAVNNNYHPISLLCVVSKVLECIIFNKISDFITEAILPNKFGFLRGQSCTQQLLFFLNEIYDSAANNTQTDVLYLDFRKAFDTIPHNKLLKKLYNIGSYMIW